MVTETLTYVSILTIVAFTIERSVRFEKIWALFLYCHTSYLSPASPAKKSAKFSGKLYILVDFLHSRVKWIIFCIHLLNFVAIYLFLVRRKRSGLQKKLQIWGIVYQINFVCAVTSAYFIFSLLCNIASWTPHCYGWGGLCEKQLEKCRWLKYETCETRNSPHDTSTSSLSEDNLGLLNYFAHIFQPARFGAGCYIEMATSYH